MELMKYKGWVLSIGLGFLLGCSTEPITGRRQLSLVSAGQETELGLTSFEQLKKETPISKDPAANALIQKVGKKIAAVAELPNAQWEFVVFESKEANAFCLPGGKVGVYTGILPITKTEEGLATVIGHEVAHAAAHHGAERMSDQMAAQTVGQALGVGMSQSDPRVAAMVQAAYGIGSQLTVLKYSRTQESAADRIGLTYMARAGYNPQEAVNFWQRFSQYSSSAGGNNTPAIFRTHPVDETRIADLKKWMPEATAAYQGKGKGAPLGSSVISR
jgi:predicted Zn-dependent protease